MFEGNHIVVTGGSSGAGLALAASLLKRGARLTLLARNLSRLEAARTLLCDNGRRTGVEIESCDVADAKAVNRSFEAIGRRSGPADILINSAGVLSEGRFDEQPLERYREILDINFFGALHCSRAVLSHFEQKGRGRIVHIASMAGLSGVHGYGPYCASKHALLGLSECMRQELAPRGVEVQVVCPPEFDSPMVDEVEKNRSRINRELVRNAGVLSTEQVVRETLRGIESGRYLTIPGRRARLLAWTARMFPGGARRFVDQQIAALSRAQSPTGPRAD